MRWMSSCVWVVAFSVGTLSVNSAFAQSPKTPPKAAPNAGNAGDDKMSQARQHYERGLQLYDEGAYDGARVEFERAYELAPTYRIFYNIGLVQRQQSDYVGALKSFESYLQEGGNQVPDVRRNEVTKEIAALKQRIGSITVSTNVPDADIAVDDVPVGKSPLKEPLLVNPGRRKISATKKGRLPATQMVEVASADKKSVSLDLNESRTVVLVEKTPRRVPWVGWVATGVLAVGAGITGYIAIKAHSDLNDAKAQSGADPDRLETLSHRTKGFSIAADVSALAAVVTGGVSLYYTIKWGKEDAAKEREREQQQSSPAVGGTISSIRATPSERGGFLRIGPQATPGGAGVGLVGAF